MNRIRTNFILNTFAQVLRIITPFITTPYVSRVLGVDNIGVFSYSYSLQSYFCLLAVLGTAAYGSREIARSRDDRETVSRAFWEIAALRTLTSLLALAGWAVVAVMQPSNTLIFVILGAYIVAAMFDISWLYTGLEKFPFIVARTVTIRVIEVISIFLFVKTSGDLPIYCAIMGGGTLIGNLTLWINLRKCVNRVPVRTLQPFRHLSGTLVFFLPAIATTIYTVLDKTLIGFITQSTYENGIYEQATKVIEIAKAITFMSLNAVLSPRSSYLFAVGDYEKIKSNLRMSLGVMLTLGFGFTFGIAAVADRFVPIFFGPGYEGTILLLRLLSPIIVIITVSNALGSQYYNPAGLRLKSSMFLIVGAVCNLILNLILIPRFQSAGAIVASVAAELIITVLYVAYCDRNLTVTQLVEISYKKLAAGIVMAGVIFLLYKVIPDTVPGLLAVVVLGGASYLISLIALRDKTMLFARNELLKRLNGIVKK